MKKGFFIFPVLTFLLFGSNGFLAQMPQESHVQVSDSLGNLLYYIFNGVVNDAATKKHLLTIRSNMIFRDTSEAREDIELLVHDEDIFDKTPGQAFSGDMRTVMFNISRGRFYLGDNILSNLNGLMAVYKVDSKGDLGLYRGADNQLLAYVRGSDITAGELSAIFYIFMTRLSLDRVAKESMKTATPVAVTANEEEISKGTIKRVWNTGQDEFVWDGVTIKRRWNSLNSEEWKYDGKTLKHAWYSGVDEGYTWDGKILKRKMSASNDEFEWDGKKLSRKWNTGNDEFTVSGNTVKRVWDSGNDEWEIDGEVPIPVIAMVVFGLLSK